MPYYGKAYGFNVRASSMKNVKLVCIGSILEEFSHAQRPGVVWSTGLHFARSAQDLRQDRVLALRGKLTKARVKLAPGATPVLGDGGLLVAPAYRRLRNNQPDPPKRYTLGIIPHYVDHAWVREHCKALTSRDDVVLIDVLSGVENVINLVAQCKYIISSSLHGLIAADSFGIPSRQFHCPTSSKINSGMFKYNDYYSVYGMSAPEPLRLTGETLSEECVHACGTFRRPGISAITAALERTLLKLPDVMKNLQSARNVARVVRVPGPSRKKPHTARNPKPTRSRIRRRVRKN